jgi:hypothetical protein
MDLRDVVAVDGVAKNGLMGDWPDMESPLVIRHCHLL